MSQDKNGARETDCEKMTFHGANMLQMTAELVPSFSGCDNTYPVSRWIDDIEDHAEIFGWTPLQQLLVARRSLTGTAELWLRAERPFKSWEHLKSSILKEFPDTIDVKAIHELMSARKKQPNEKCLDYMLVMKEAISKDYYIDNLDKKLENFIMTCIPCLLATRKAGKQEGFLNPLEKEGTPLHTIHIDHLGPLTETKKLYNHILTIVDAFTKFTWIFPTKSTTSRETIEKLKIHQQNFGNPVRIISDRGTAFTSGEFKEYCEEENIQHITITTGVPRGNGQVERLHKTILAVLTKLCIEDPSMWYRQVSKVQRALNSTYQRSIDTTPFRLMIGTAMRVKEDLKILELIQKEEVNQYEENREEMRVKAKEQIFKVQEENRRTYDKKRKQSSKYNEGDLVAIKRTQFGTGLKLKPKFLGPYRVVKVKRNDRYDVVKEDSTAEGPNRTSTSADFMKPWPTPDDD